MGVHLPQSDVSRFAIVGTTGSGKSTLARRLSKRLGIPHAEMDALHHGPNWTQTPDEIFRERVSAALVGDRWVVDGNYSVARDLVWPRANVLVWLDYPLRVVMWRLFWRTLRRGVTQQELWNGNRESLWRQFCTKDSLFLWAYGTRKRWKREIPIAVVQPEHTHLKLVHLRSTGEARKWLSQVTTSGT